MENTEVNTTTKTIEMKISKKQIEQTFSFPFSKNPKDNKLWIIANNYREPMIELTRNSTRITVNEIRLMAKFLNECANIIEKDADLKTD